MDCRGCRYYKNLADNHCIGCNGSRYTKPSNADHIRAMSDEELAEWFNTMNGIDKICPDYGAHNCQESCRKCWLDWLKQEATDG